MTKKLDLEQSIKTLKKCGVYRCTDLNEKEQGNIYGLLDRDTSLSCNEETLFVYKHDYDHIFQLDMINNTVYIDFHYMTEAKSIRQMITQLFGRFSKMRHMVFTYIIPSRIKSLKRELRKCSKLDMIWWKDIGKPQLFISRTKIPVTPDGIIHDCKVTLYADYGCKDIICEYKHKQVITIKDNTMYIRFQPPMLIPHPTKIRMPLKLSNSFYTIQTVDSDAPTYPRWDKLESMTKKWEDYEIFYLPKAYTIRQELIIDLDADPQGYYKEHYEEFRRYARVVFQALNRSALRIERAWRTCISDPSFTMCKKRLESELEELVEEA